MTRDFIDDDLLNLSRSRLKSDAEARLPAQPGLSKEGLARMHQQKSELNHHVADAVHEIEELKQRQSALEREKRELEELGRRQDEYTHNKKDIVEKIAGSIILLEKEEMQAARILELFGVMRGKFKDTLVELRAISEDGWSEEAYQMELNKAIVIVEDARSTFQRGIAKMEAAGWTQRNAGVGVVSPVEVATKLQGQNFMYWLKVGTAISIPFAVVGMIIFVLRLLFDGGYFG